MQHVSLFIRADEARAFELEADLRGTVIGVTNNGTAVNEWAVINDVEIVEVSRLEQKIGMLLKGRLDAFSHFEQSAMRMLNARGMSESVKKAKHQPSIAFEFYFALSSNSRLISRKSYIEAIIARGSRQALLPRYINSITRNNPSIAVSL